MNWAVRPGDPGPPEVSGCTAAGQQAMQIPSGLLQSSFGLSSLTAEAAQKATANDRVPFSVQE